MDYVLIIVLEMLRAISWLVLLASGLAIIFGMMNVINLAHGEFLTIGAYTAAAMAAITVCATSSASMATAVISIDCASASATPAPLTASPPMCSTSPLRPIAT